MNTILVPVSSLPCLAAWQDYRARLVETFPVQEESTKRGRIALRDVDRIDRDFEAASDEVAKRLWVDPPDPNYVPGPPIPVYDPGPYDPFHSRNIPRFGIDD